MAWSLWEIAENLFRMAPLLIKTWETIPKLFRKHEYSLQNQPWGSFQFLNHLHWNLSFKKCLQSCITSFILISSIFFIWFPWFSVLVLDIIITWYGALRSEGGKLFRNHACGNYFRLENVASFIIIIITKKL